jgi:putative inorganic carbon (HCO3(-)) transporter
MLDGLSIQPQRLRSLSAPVGVGALALLLLIGATIAARSSPAAFILCGLALTVLVGVAAIRWPRTAIVVVVLSPIMDRYIVADMLPPELASASHYLSEGLLLTVGLILAARALREGTLLGAFRHPVTAAFIAFSAIAVVSATLNGVPPHIALIGIVFTIDAAALFFLPRLIGFSQHQAIAAISVLVSIVFVSAVLAVAQGLLSARILGLVPVRGRFGEEVRLASLFGDPNVFGAFLVTAVPFAILGAARLPSRRLRWLAAAVAFVLLLALWLSFSRGAWIALVLGVGTMLAIIDRRALLIGLVLCVASFATAAEMPRNLLVPRAPRPNIVDSTIDRVETVGIGGDLRTLFVINALPIIRDHPLLGVGPGRYGGAVAHTFGTPVYAEYETDVLFWRPTQRTVDNFWLHLLVETGFIGLAAFLTAAFIPGLRILGAARRSIGTRRILLGGIAAAATGMAVSSATTMLLEANSIGFPFWFLLGIGLLTVEAMTVRAEETPAA